MRRRKVPSSGVVGLPTLVTAPAVATEGTAQQVHGALDGHSCKKLAPTKPLSEPEQTEFEAEPRIARRDRFSEGLVAKAQLVFGTRLKRDVSPDEARLMLGDLTDFYELAVVRLKRFDREA